MDPRVFALLPVTILGAIMFVVGLFFAFKERRETRARKATPPDHH